jgi:hypothetical protein
VRFGFCFPSHIPGVPPNPGHGVRRFEKMALLLSFSPAVLGIAGVAVLLIFLLFRKPKLPPGVKRLPGPKGSLLLDLIVSNSS